MNKITFRVIITVLLMTFSLQAYSVVYENQILIPNPENAYLRYGYSIASYSDWLCIGNLGANTIYLYHKTNGIWLFNNTIIPPLPLDSLVFGISVSMHENNMIIGAGHNLSSPPSGGKSLIYNKTGNNWDLAATLSSPSTVGFDSYGKQVCISDTIAVVSAYTDSQNGTESGAVYTYHLVNGSWEFMQRITPLNADVNDRFGACISLDGDYLAVGALRDNENYTSSGAAYVFHNNNGIWEQMAYLHGSDQEDFDFYAGWGLSINQGCLVVGASGYNESKGAAYIYNLINNQWVQTAMLISGENRLSGFGSSASLNSNILTVGAPLDNMHGGASGAAYLFQYRHNQWINIARLEASDAATADRFGSSVASIHNGCLVGSYNADNSFTDSGEAYYYDLSGLVAVDDSVVPFFDRLDINPNPFSLTTEISCKTNDYASIAVRIYNVKGQLIRILHETEIQPVVHNYVWDGRDEYNRSVASGVYFIHLKSAEHTNIKKVMLQK